ncbi:DUF2306 domain-containing protein [Planctobacterium marinum]|uniref:DUF2306 domain-containing protein n=1 Tax=Planctobacterium marinum TaxID=1631968 RepID=UPI001E40388F|nr:DUF2306 domain-containing protein [Planctobacterium marinum]MCC2606434.1 DUF2306 domain-containing protein [Planctobacterium marinum]
MTTIKQHLNWSILGLYLLGLISILSGTLQLEALNTGLISGDASHDPEVPHYYQIPLPIILHIIAGVAFNLLSPLQFSANIRAKAPWFHKSAGILLVFSALTAGTTALIMNQVYPAFGGYLKYFGVMTFALASCICVVFGIVKIRQGKIAEHRAWMIRTTAVALGPATQRLFFIPAFLVLGQIDQLVIGIGIWVGFALNLLIAELFIIRNVKEAKPLAKLADQTI